MIVLDTNVISEMMKPEPLRSTAVLAWLHSNPNDAFYTTATTVAEILTGIAVLPDGQRRDRVSRAAAAAFAQFGPRILAFDRASANQFASLYARRRQLGLGVSDPMDLQIAAIAQNASMAIATRNVSDFDGCDIDVIDPWTALL